MPNEHVNLKYKLKNKVEKAKKKNDEKSVSDDNMDKKILKEEVDNLRRQVEELQVLHRKDTGLLKSALTSSHDELQTFGTNLKESVTNEIDLLHRMTLELHALCQRNNVVMGAQTTQQQTSSPLSPTIDIFTGKAAFAEALGPIPSETEQKVQEIEILLEPLKHDLLLLTDAIQDSSMRTREKDEESLRGSKPSPRFLNFANYASENEVELEHDIFNIFILSENWSIPFFYPLLIAVFQFFITALIMIDLLVEEDRPRGVVNENIGNLPPKVNWQVTCAQFASLIIAFVTVNDMITSAKMFVIGFDPNVKIQNPGASYLKFIIANSIRFIEGTSTICLSLVIIMQADSVLDIFMNFAAVAFVSELDNLAFDLAQEGLVGEGLEEACDRVMQTKMKVRPGRRKLGWVTNFLFVVFFLPFLVILLLVSARQRNGSILYNTACKNLEVHFGDEMLRFPPDVRFRFENAEVNGGIDKTFPNSPRRLPFLEERPTPLLYQYFSGTYIAETEDTARRDRLREFNDRPVYFERGVNDITSGKFYFCEAISSWVFTIEALYNTPGAIPEEAREECEWGWLLQSPTTRAMTLEEAPMGGWNIWTGQMQQVDPLAFHISCSDCERNSDCGLTHGTCDTDSGTCICNEEWQGRQCNERNPYCQGLMLISYGESSHKYKETGPFHRTFSEATHDFETFYDRPGYWILAEATNEEDYLLNVIMYTGRRWFGTYWPSSDMHVMEEIDFHAYWENVLNRQTVFYSDPTENYHPTGIDWYEIRRSQSQGDYGLFGASFWRDLRFQCLDLHCINDVGTCGLYGTCRKGMTEPFIFYNQTIVEGFPMTYCDCHDDYGGYYCEHEPNGLYSGKMYDEYIQDPVSYYNNNSDLPYLKYWTSHTSGTETNDLTTPENDNEMSENGPDDREL